ncbi:MAG: ABC transporter ATP-binding protein [Bacillota bacterium]|nr:ABC transporter ATP-binding protein [Bacillota bacterium]
MSELAIDVRGLKRRLGGFLLDIPRLSLERGYVLGLLGRNAAGKSTAIGTLLNLVHPDEGLIRILGLELPGAQTEVRRRIGFVPEQPAFYANLTADQMAGLVRPFYPRWDPALYRRYVQRLEVDTSKPIGSLSKGMKVRFALVLALAHRPDLLLLDEPTAGLDPVVRQEVMCEIAALVKDGEHSALISSHITSDVDRIADYIAIIEDGKLIEHENREALVERWRKVVGCLPGRQVQLDPLFVSYYQKDGSFLAVTNAYSEALLNQLALAGASVTSTAKLTLDEILAFATGRGRLTGEEGGRDGEPTGR